MRAAPFVSLMIAAALPRLAAAEEARPISPAEAVRRVGERVSVEMLVQASKDRLLKRGEIYLDSEKDFHDPRNLGVVITQTGAAKFEAAGISDPAGHFLGKTIRVHGKVVLKEKRPRIEIEDPQQIEVLDESSARRVKTGMAEVAEPLLYYEECGSGEPVVLIHGGQLDCRMWDDQFRKFAQRYRVIRYDVRGYGKSEMPSRPYADEKDLLGLLDFLHIDRAHLVGLSLGGRIAIDFAVRYPQRVKSLVLAGPGLSGYQWAADEAQRGEHIDKAARDESAEAAAALWLKDPYMAPAMENPQLVPRLRRLAMENARCWLINPMLGRALVPPAIKRLGEIRAPTLIIVGDRDVPDIQAIVKLLEKGIRGARKVVIAGSGHMVNMEKPRAFNRAVLEFLQANETTPRKGDESKTQP